MKQRATLHATGDATGRRSDAERRSGAELLLSASLVLWVACARGEPSRDASSVAQVAAQVPAKAPALEQDTAAQNPHRLRAPDTVASLDANAMVNWRVDRAHGAGALSVLNTLCNTMAPRCAKTC